MHNRPNAMQGTPKEESQDVPAPTATAQRGPYSLMFRPKGGSVLSLAIHLCSAAFLYLSDQHAFFSSPVMNSEAGPHQDILEVPVFPVTVGPIGVCRADSPQARIFVDWEMMVRPGGTKKRTAQDSGTLWI
ncbi:unnamed protein product [Arctogadus glacialis]